MKYFIIKENEAYSIITVKQGQEEAFWDKQGHQVVVQAASLGEILQKFGKPLK